ncbi:aluminum-activated malate transporter 8-like [Cornus florida]|uniref:aluminum-activated malate transporter 8-like n=1 Tax=Cornus florida TaxID=4283 RepID=UPI00289EE2EA|nr:aluminum-activated malate transporter 8-like [Cornus florida]
MEINESATTGTRWSGRIKAFPGKLKDKVIDVAKKTKDIGQDDPRKIVHSLKVGLALTLVSMFYYFRPIYDGFGVAGMWAVLTVVVIFEFTVGATLSKGINRGFATLVAGALGVGVEHLARLFGDKGEPILLGFSVFLLAAISTFTRFVPHIKARYDYGVMIFILTFSLVAVSGYRLEKIVELAHQRLSTIVMGGAICIIISIFICPVWAGEDLHKLVALNLEKLGIFLQGFGDEYFKLSDEDAGDSAHVVSKDDKKFMQDYKTVLNSKATEESLANFAWWEPCHGRFKFRHPWKQYLKIGLLSRQCACKIEALSGYINSHVQAPLEFRQKIREPCTKMSSESGKALKELASAIKKMKNPSSANVHVQNSKIAVDELKSVLEAASVTQKEDVLEIIPAVTVASILMDITECVEKISESIHELSNLAHFNSVESIVSPEKPQLLLHRGTIKPFSDGDGDHVVITVSPEEGDFSSTKDGRNNKAEEV